MYILIIINTILIGLNTFPSISNISIFEIIFKLITWLTIIVLILKNIIVIICKVQVSIKHGIKHLFSFLFLIELFIIMLVLFYGYESNMTFILLIKMFKISEYFGDTDNYSPINILKRTFTNKKEELIITISFSTGLLILCSFIIYFIEVSEQPEVFNNIVPSFNWTFGVLTGYASIDFNPVTPLGNVFYIIMKVLGILIVGLPLGIITGSFISEIEASKENEILKTKSNTIINAFRFEQKITLRKLVDSLKLPSSRKFLDIDFAMARLEYTMDDIFQAVRFSSSLRVRSCKKTINSSFEDNLILEYFPVNEMFGSFINRNSSIHIVSTQNCGDMGIGHFSRLIAEALNANYYANEFYSSANLDPNKQINFAVNSSYGEKDLQSAEQSMKEWVYRLKNNIKPSDLVVYFGTCGTNREGDIHILCGGEKKEIFEKIKNPTFSEMDRIISFSDDIKNLMKRFNYKVVGHNEFGNTDKNHLSVSIRQNYRANVVSLYINQSILIYSKLEDYYEIMQLLIDNINKHLLKPYNESK